MMSNINKFWASQLQNNIRMNIKREAPLKCKLKFLFKRRNYYGDFFKHVDGCRLLLCHCIDEECRFHYKPPTVKTIKIVGNDAPVKSYYSHCERYGGK